ncbi:MAG: hypothetical protein KF760_24760 [Candidatus Eremiobacteraeota bacterium]|nr:hypothetical protein [Candidatus Eremiobacteraeota bacterium]MCW5871886.1 hypothetical protein [Candidatus Eremiobacteraeota bacterium]
MENEQDETLANLINNYQVSSNLQQEVLTNIRRIADSASNVTDAETKLTAGEATILWALSQQLDVIRSQMTQLEQLNLAILKHLLQHEQAHQ